MGGECTPGADDRRLTGPRVAAIDVGTNTVLLLIARRGGTGQLEVIEDHCATPRLGTGLARTGRLDGVAADRTLEVLKQYVGRVRALGISPTHLRAVGTAVLRRAADADQFVARVRAETGLSIEILAEGEEAQLAFDAATGGSGSPDTLVIDVGGGSSEVVGGGGRDRRSAPIGAVLLTETYLGDSPVKAGGWEGLVREVEAACLVFEDGGAFRDGRAREVVLLGGTALNLGALTLGLERFDPVAAEGALVDVGQAGRWATMLAAKIFRERIAWPIEATRAEILPAGLACIEAILKRLRAPSARVSGRGLRFGLAHRLCNR